MNKNRSPLLGNSQISMYKTFIQCRSRKLIIYDKYIGNGKSTKQRNVNLKANFKDAKTYSGNCTKSMLQRMEFALDTLWNVTGIRELNRYQKRKLKVVTQHLSFITLTIPTQSKRISGKDAYDKLLAPFIQWLKRKKHVTHYVWKAELQQPTDFMGNEKLCKGQLHYHIILPNYLDKGEIRQKWNYYLKINGLMSEYSQKTGNDNPPSTWIGGLRKSTGASYLMKEIMKNVVSQSDIDKYSYSINQKLYTIRTTLNCRNDNEIQSEVNIMLKKLDIMIANLAYSNDSINGKVWGCSDNLQPKTITDENGFKEKKKYFTVELTEELEKKLHDLNIRSKANGFEMRSYLDGENIPKLILGSDGNYYPNPKYTDASRFEILTVPNLYQERLLNYKIFDGYDKDFKPIYKTALEDYKKHLSLFGANIKIRETVKRKYIALSNVSIDVAGNFVSTKRKTYKKSILEIV